MIYRNNTFKMKLNARELSFKQISNKIKVICIFNLQSIICLKKKKKERKSTEKRLDNSNILKVVRELPYKIRLIYY